ANYCEGDRYDVWTYQFNSVCPGDYWQIPFWWDKLVSDSAFQKQTFCRWQELRSTVLDTVNLFGAIDSMANEVDEAKERHFDKFPILGNYVWPNPNPLAVTFAQEIRNTKDWIINRLTWLDSNMIGKSFAPCPDLTLNNPESSKNISLTIYPNPAHDFIKLNLETPKAGQYMIELFDLMGKRHLIISNDLFEKDDYSFLLNIHSLSTGLYYIRISNNFNELKTVKFIKN
ncbi:MAG: T9SS type A sorting domain-containing protein, partial [Bacteroidota bacterium]